MISPTSGKIMRVGLLAGLLPNLTGWPGKLLEP